MFNYHMFYILLVGGSKLPGKLHYLVRWLSGITYVGLPSPTVFALFVLQGGRENPSPLTQIHRVQIQT